MILCEKTKTKLEEQTLAFMFADGNEGKSLTCMNLYFSSLCMMMGRMTDGREEKEKDVNRKKRMA